MTEHPTLPDGWVATTLGALGTYNNGRGFKRSEWSVRGRPIIRIQDLTGSKNNSHRYEGPVEDRHVVHPGDLLISWAATLGAYIWNGPEGVLNQHIFKVESKIDKRFHYHLARYCIAELQRNAHGSGMVHVTKSTFEETPVAVPTEVAAQIAVANAIEDLARTRSSASSHVARARAALSQLRSSLLVAAFAGRLTDEVENADSQTGGVTNLAPDSSQSGKRKKRDRTDGFTPFALPSIPASWEWRTVGDVCSQVTDGEHIQPPYQSRGLPMLSAKHVRDGYVDPSGAGLISVSDFNNALRRCAPERGDILVVSVGDVGRSAIVEADEPFAIVRSVLLLKPTISSRFLLRWLQHPWAFQWMTQASGASVQAHLYIRDAKRMPIPVPSLPEQEAIADCVDKMLDAVRAVGPRLEACEAQIARSERAVLAMAFRGDLVVNHASRA